MYKIAVVDIDGTMVTTKKAVTGFTRDTVRELSEKDIPVCICTGRNVSSTLPVVRKLVLRTPFICIDGMIMYDISNNKIIHENRADMAVLRKVLDIAAERDVYLEVVTSRHYNRRMVTKTQEQYKFGKNKATLITRYYDYKFGIRNVKNVRRFYSGDEHIYQIVIGCGEAELAAIHAEITRLNEPGLSIRSMWGDYLFVSAEGVCKSAGMELLCRHFGFGVEDAVAIGDEENDIDMIRAAGMGVAMGNAIPQVKEAAGYITRTNDEDGAALALRKFFMDEMKK